MFNVYGYVPSIAVRPSELEALRRLPDADKNVLLPSIKLRKWYNSGSLEKSFNALTEAFGDRWTVLDLGDPPEVLKSECDHQLAALTSSADGHAAWVALLQNRATMTPTLQWGGSPQETATQAANLAGLGRGLAIRLRRARQWDLVNLSSLSALDLGSMPLLLVLEFGQITGRTDLTAAAAELAGVTNAALAMLQTSNPTVTLAASSFPAEFASINREHARLPIHERGLFSLLSAAPPFANGAVPLVYGDFASVCCDRGTMARGGAPRIDLASRNEWAYYRREEDQSYVAAAQAIQADPAWNPDLYIWGTNEIRRAALGDLSDLHLPRRWVAVRINTHLHQQIHYGSPGALLETDEPWVD